MSTTITCLFSLSILLLCFLQSGLSNTFNNTAESLSPGLPLPTSQISPSLPILVMASSTLDLDSNSPTPQLSSDFVTTSELPTDYKSKTEDGVSLSYGTDYNSKLVFPTVTYFGGGYGNVSEGGGFASDKYDQSVVSATPTDYMSHGASTAGDILPLPQQISSTQNVPLSDYLSTHISISNTLEVMDTYDFHSVGESSLLSSISSGNVSSENVTMTIRNIKSTLVVDSLSPYSLSPSLSTNMHTQVTSIQTDYSEGIQPTKTQASFTSTQLFSTFTSLSLDSEVTQSTTGALTMLTTDNQSAVVLTTPVMLTSTSSHIEDTSSTQSFAATSMSPETEDSTAFAPEDTTEDLSSSLPTTAPTTIISTTAVPITHSTYTLSFSGNCSVLFLLDGAELFKQQLTTILADSLSINASRITLSDIRCGSVLINVTIADTQGTDIDRQLQSTTPSNIAVVFDANNVSYTYTGQSIVVLSSPLQPSSVVMSASTTTSGESPMNMQGKSNDEQIRMIIIIVCAVGGGLLVLVILICIIYHCRRKCANRSGTFYLGDTPSPHIKSEDFKLEKMPRTPGYYGEDGYVVKADYNDGVYIENKTSPDSGTFSIAENGAQNDDNQNEKPSHYDNKEVEEITGRRLSREALVKDQRSESPGYDNPSFSEDEILNTPEPECCSVDIEEPVHPAAISVETELSPKEPVITSTTAAENQTAAPELQPMVSEEQQAELASPPAVTEEYAAESPVSMSQSNVQTNIPTPDSKHSSSSDLSSASGREVDEEEPLPPPPSFVVNDSNEDSIDGAQSYDLQQAESAELTLPVEHINIADPTSAAVGSSESSSKDVGDDAASTRSSASSKSSTSDSSHSKHSEQASDAASQSHKELRPTISFPPPPDVGPETADQGSLTELDDRDAYDEVLHSSDDNHHSDIEDEEKSALARDAEAATLF